MLFLCICKFCSVLKVYLRYCSFQKDFSITSHLHWVALCLFLFYHRTKQNLLYFVTALEISVHVSEFYFLVGFFILIFTLFYFTILYWFCHTLTWICHGCTWVPNHEPPSHLPPHVISLDLPRAPAPSILYPVSNIDWRFVSYLIVYMFQCHSPKSSHPLPLPLSPKVRSIHLCLFCCIAYWVVIAIFLNSIYMC